MANDQELIADGLRAERAGALDRATESYVTAVTVSTDPAIRSEALTHLADVSRTRCDWDHALQCARQAQEIAAAAGLDQHRFEALNAETLVLITRGDFAAAIPKCETIAAKATDLRLRGIALQNLGSIYAQIGELPAAERAFRDSLGCFQRCEYVRGQGITLNNLGRLALDREDVATARPLLEEALGAARDVEDADLAALVSLNLASALCHGGELDRAQDCAMAALGYFADCDNRWREIECLRLIGDINVRCEDIDKATRCYDLAIKLGEEIGADAEVQLTRDRVQSLSRPQPPR